MKREDAACHGADTIEVQGCGTSYEECLACRSRVRWDLVDHPFFGFKKHDCDMRFKWDDELFPVAR